jgi:glucose/arabinose dehydrogenase
MRTKARAAALALAALAAASLPGQAVAQQRGARVLIEGLEFPAGIDFLDDGRMVVTERVGRVRIATGSRLDPQPLAEIPTTTQGETGLLDVAVPPDQSADPNVYVFATEADGGSNTVWRIPLEGGEPVRVITGLPAATYHNGGGIDFGPDGKLYVSNGEQHDGARARDPRALGGKVYRFNRDGTIPDDNPFSGSPAFAVGLRNPFGLTIDPSSGDVWVTENGPDSFDEINHVVAEADFGWPDVSGPGCPDPCRDPVLAYESIIVPTGIAFAGARGGRFSGDLFFGTYAEGSIHRVELNHARDDAVSDEVFLRPGASVVAVEWGPRGLYFSTPEDVRFVPLARKGGRADEEEAQGEPAASPEAGDPGSSPSPASPFPAVPGGDRAFSPAAGLVVVALVGALLFMRARFVRHDRAGGGDDSGASPR